VQRVVKILGGLVYTVTNEKEEDRLNYSVYSTSIYIYSNWQLPMGEMVPCWLRCLFGGGFLALYDTCSLILILPLINYIYLLMTN
jgi:hypothetical protein